MPAQIAAVPAFAAIDNNSVIGVQNITAFAALVAQQGVGIAPIFIGSDVYSKNKVWSSTDPRLRSQTYRRVNVVVYLRDGFKGGGWQFATYFEEL